MHYGTITISVTQFANCKKKFVFPCKWSKTVAPQPRQRPGTNESVTLTENANGQGQSLRG